MFLEKLDDPFVLTITAQFEGITFLEFGIYLSMPENHALTYGLRLIEAVKFIRKVFEVIPSEYRDEFADIEKLPTKDVSQNKKIQVSLKLAKADYLQCASEVFTKVLKVWKETEQRELPTGVKKGDPPTVLPGCIKITQFFEMEAGADPSEMLKWMLDEKRHLMSTFTFNGEIVSEPDIGYCSPDEARILSIPNKVWFVFRAPTEQLIQDVESFLQKHKYLEKEPYRHVDFPNVELQQYDWEGERRITPLMAVISDLSRNDFMHNFSFIHLFNPQSSNARWCRTG